jgi:hypothetical protein
MSKDVTIRAGPARYASDTPARLELAPVEVGGGSSKKLQRDSPRKCQC